MKHLRKNGGFTLIELVVGIVIASLVTMAAITVLMLAMRVNCQTSDTASQQNTVRTLLTTMEKAATDGSIKGLLADLDSWQLVTEQIKYTDGQIEPFSARVIFGFDSETQTIYTNGLIEVRIDEDKNKPVYVVTEGVPILQGVYASNAGIRNGLLSFAVETKEGTFETTVFLRSGSIDSNVETAKPEDNDNASIDKFLAILMSQLNSDGKINYDSLKEVLNGLTVHEEPKSKETYYSEWYINQTYLNGVGQGGWNADTPWCACYVSWALAEAGVVNPPKYANVDEFMNHFGSLSEDAPAPGDLVFFDWLTDDGVDDPQHVGVVLHLVFVPLYPVSRIVQYTVGIRASP